MAYSIPRRLRNIGARLSGSRPVSGATLYVMMLITSCCTVAVFQAWMLGPSLEQLLGLSNLAWTGSDRALAHWTMAGNTLTLLAPVVLGAAGLLVTGRRRATTLLFLAGHGVAVTALTLDVLIYRTFGLHLSTIGAYAMLPHRWEVAGNPWQWLWLCVRWGTALTFLLLTAWQLSAWAGQRLDRASKSFRSFLAVAATVAWAAAALGPYAAGKAWDDQALAERLHGALPADLRMRRQGSIHQPFSDPAMRESAEGIEKRWRSWFPLVLAPRPNDTTAALPKESSRPNIIFIVLESFRADSIDPRWMPKLHAWSLGGLRSRRHYASSNYSEAGLFSLLYARSPLVFHATLDGRIAPTANEILRRSGYVTAWFSGHPKVWMRREDYVNPDTFDRFVHDDHGGWNDWDRRALGAMVEMAGRGDRPLFAVVFLMSTHFEYAYPPEYERFTPVDRDAKWSATRAMSSLTAEQAPLLLNRYRNTLAFLDDSIMDAIDRLDPAKNIVVLTGDHGESIHDDGRYGHGYSFSDIVAQVPLVIRGPGIAPAELQGMTAHMDVLPTVLHAAAGAPVPFQHQHGMDLLAAPAARRSLLLAHCDVNRELATGLLLAQDRRLNLTFNLRVPAVTFGGFEDALARLQSPGTTPVDAVPALIEAFDAEMHTIAR